MTTLEGYFLATNIIFLGAIIVLLRSAAKMHHESKCARAMAKDLIEFYVTYQSTPEEQLITDFRMFVDRKYGIKR